jgi:hypothetical protein
MSFWAASIADWLLAALLYCGFHTAGGGLILINRQSVSGQAPTPDEEMRRSGSGMRLTLLFLGVFASVLDAQREQHLFSLETAHKQTLPVQHHQPWSLLLSQNIVTSNCIILEPPELAQTHKSIKEFGDVLILNKSSSNERGTECAEENTLEILGFDQRSVWIKVSELCSTIDYKYSTEIATLADYEVVCCCLCVS